MTTERIISAARAVAGRGTDATGPSTRLTSTAEPLASVLARLELADEPRLLSIIATPLADVARVKDMLRAIPASAPRFVDTDDRAPSHPPHARRVCRHRPPARAADGRRGARGQRHLARRRPIRVVRVTS